MPGHPRVIIIAKQLQGHMFCITLSSRAAAGWLYAMSPDQFMFRASIPQAY